MNTNGIHPSMYDEFYESKEEKAFASFYESLSKRLPGISESDSFDYFSAGISVGYAAAEHVAHEG